MTIERVNNYEIIRVLSLEEEDENSVSAER